VTNPDEIMALDRAWRSDPEESFSILLALGSEHLRAQNLMEARSAFERADIMRPGDAEVQNLLGLTNFKLGEFDSAQRIFEDLVQRFPDAIALELNVALVLLKSGKFELARDHLQKIVQREPTHPRAGSYLGLVYEQLGDLRAAGEAYKRAGNLKAAAKIEQAASDNGGAEPQLSTKADDAAGNAEAPDAAGAAARLGLAAELAAERSTADAELAEAVRALEESARPVGDPPAAAPPAAVATAPELPSPTPAPPATAAPSTELPELSLQPLSDSPPEPAVDATAATDLSELQPLDKEAAVTILDGLVQLRLDEHALVRSDRWVGRFGDLKVEPVMRRQRGKETDEHLGGERPVVHVEGRGTALLRFDERSVVSASFDEELFVIESRLLALLGSCHHETGRLTMPDRTVLHLLRLRGSACAIIAADRTPARVRIALGPPLVVQAAALVAFTGKVLPRVAKGDPSPADEPPVLNLLGEGEAWIDGGTLTPFEISPVSA